ncbi:MAG: hypothetical protein HY760_05425 [Nitrospirae bacterium]|nr:hypothetical protein [Nitrospirota bacterium]
MWFRSRLVFILVSALFFTACGYQFAGIPEDTPFSRPALETGQTPSRAGQTLAIPFFINDTGEPLIEEEITPVVLREFIRDGRLRLTGTGEAAMILYVRITSYRQTPLSFDADQNVREYRATITMKGRLEDRRDGNVLWDGEVSASAEYPVTSDVNATRTAKRGAVGEAARDLAESLVDRVIEGF